MIVETILCYEHASTNHGFLDNDRANENYLTILRNAHNVRMLEIPTKERVHEAECRAKFGVAGTAYLHEKRKNRHGRFLRDSSR